MCFNRILVISPGENSHIKGWGCLSEILKRTPSRYQDAVLWAWLELFSTPRATNSKTTLSPVIFFSTQQPKRYCKSSYCGPFEAEYPKRHQTCFFKLYYYMEKSVLLGTKPLVDSIRHFIRDPSGVFSVCHLCECRIVQ